MLSWPEIFGCKECEDSLDHYLTCEVMWPILTSCAKLGREWLVVGTAMKLGLHNPTRTSVSLTLVAHRVYHKLRFQYASVVMEAQQSGHYDALIDLALELGIICSSDFSLR